MRRFLMCVVNNKTEGRFKMANEKKLVEAITSMEEDFAQWYTDVVKKAELIDYSQSIEDNPAPQEETFQFILVFIYMEEKNQISFDYWCTTENSELEVVFEYKENKFFLRTYGAIDNIPGNWEEE